MKTHPMIRTMAGEKLVALLCSSGSNEQQCNAAE
jgi:hypothetical protein